MIPFRLAGFVLAVSTFAACHADRPGCLDHSSRNCLPAAPCEALTFQCASSTPTAFRILDGSERRGGLEAVAAIGDYVLDNGLVRAVIDDLDHPNFLAFSGGTLVDLLEVGGNDALNQISQVTGILPRDAVFYDQIDASTKGDRATIIVHGSLVGDTRIRVATRYELRACDRGVRIRTEIYNGSREAKAFFLGDTMYLGGRGLTPMVPVAGTGFNYPDLDLAEIEKAFRSAPFISLQSHLGTIEGNVSYAAVSCSRSRLDGIDNSIISAFGEPRSLVMPGDGLSYERFVAVASGAGSNHAQRLALEARKQLLNERYVIARGHVRIDPPRLDYDERLASFLFTSEGITLAEAVPSSLGELEVALPAGRPYTIERYMFGRLAGTPLTIDVGGDDVDLGDIDITPPASLQVHVTVDGLARTTELVLVPVAPDADEGGTVYGQFEACQPYLGPPHGASPACNRVLARDGDARFDAPPGHYWVYATHGPNTSLARSEVTLHSGESVSIALALTTLAVFPADSLTADFHVHGTRSFDTMIPDRDRVLSFLATDLQVLAATDHDVVGSYTETIAELGAADAIYAIPGVELTSLLLHYKRDGSAIPRTLGHFNFWPMPYDPAQPRNGAPWDELKEPGELYTELRGYVGDAGVSQLNHPFAESLFGRDEGYARAIGYDPRQDIKAKADKTAAGQWRRAPNGGLSNLDHDVQEVMNGAAVLNFIQYRALWHAFLRQGIVKAGTANSDSHSLQLEQVGYPRNIVEGRHGFPALDVASFNAAVKNGRMVGTNGPYIDAQLHDGTEVSTPSLTPHLIDGDEGFAIVVRAAPWMPVTELRIIVNGALVKTVPINATPANPFGSDDVVRLSTSFTVAELAPDGGTVVFEAGVALPEGRDKKDPADADEDEDGVIDHIDTTKPRPDDPRYHIDVVSPGTHPTAFTNPFVLVKQ